LEPTGRRIQVIFHDVVIADSVRTLRILETSHPPVYYIPPEDVRMQYLERTSRSTFCEWKGAAAYFDVVVDDWRAENAAWFYPEPVEAYRELRNYIAFYPAPMDACLVDGERARPERAAFYGGWVTDDIRV
jgi:uncharacterized protein (DUF427 family)